MIKCCIFDLDGTILNTITTITYYVNRTLESYKIDCVTEDECKYFAGNGARLLIERALRSKGICDKILAKKILKDYNEAYDKYPLHLTAPFESVDELIKQLKARGIKLAVLSNKPDSTVKSIVSHFFGDSFDIVLGGRDGIPLKPDPTVPQQIIEELGIDKNETAWVGDTGTDVETGKNLGVRLNIGVLWGFRPKEELVSSGADVTVSAVNEILAEVLKID